MLRFLFLLFLLFDPAVWEVVGVWEGGVAGGLLSRGWLLAGGVVWEVWSLWFLSRIRCDLLVAARFKRCYHRYREILAKPQMESYPPLKGRF